jgi:hypothetical protein
MAKNGRLDRTSLEDGRPVDEKAGEGGGVDPRTCLA